MDKKDAAGNPSDTSIKAQKGCKMNIVAVGIDIAKITYEAHIQYQEQSYSKSFKNDSSDFPKLVTWIRGRSEGDIHVCMEASNRYWEKLAKYLYAEGIRVSVMNPTRIHNYAKCKLARNKTDALDAALIADYCATQNPPVWIPPAPHIQELQAMQRHLEALKRMRNQEANREDGYNPSPEVRKLIKEHIAILDQQIEQLLASIDDFIENHTDLQTKRTLLTSIPGIADLTASKLLAENIQAFTSAKELVAYAGLNPSQHVSGTSVRHKSKLSKIGNAQIRRSLYFPAVVAMHHNPCIVQLCERLEKKEKHKMVIVGAAMRKLLVLCYGVLKSGVPFDPAFCTIGS